MTKKMNTNSNSPDFFKRLMRYVIPYWPILLLGIVSNMVYAGIDAGFVYMLKPFLNKGFIDRDLEFIRWIPVLTMVAFVFRGTASFSATYCMTWVARSVVTSFRQSMFAHFLKLPAKYYDSASSGQMLSKLLYDIEQVAQVSSDALTIFVQSACLVVGLFTVMFINSWRLTLIYMLTVPAIALIVTFSNRRIRRVSLQTQKAMSEVTEIAEEAIEGYQVVRIYGGQDYEYQKFCDASNRSRRSDIKAATTKAYSVSGALLVAASGVSFIIYLAISPGATTALTAGAFVSLISAMLALLKPLKNLTTVSSSIQRGLAGAESVFTTLDTLVEVDEGVEEFSGRAKGRVEFNQVSFSYLDGTHESVLKDISFTIEPGETVALVGRSGSGKSTIVSLLARFYEADAGVISLDGMNICDLTLKSLRSQIAFVNQNVTLFNDTIAKNIAYGQSATCSLTQIEEAAIAAHAMDFIVDLPQGLDTIVGENGVLLSGGQRQRLAIARAIIKDAPVLILDEATSALDTESERHIQAALDEVMRDRTTIVIAHRLTTIENADKIVVLDQGQIVEVGSHHALLQQNGHYARLHAMQFNEYVVEPTAKKSVLEAATL